MLLEDSWGLLTQPVSQLELNLIHKRRLDASQREFTESEEAFLTRVARIGQLVVERLRCERRWRHRAYSLA